MVEEIRKTEVREKWTTVKLGDYVTAVKGKKPRTVASEKNEACPIPYINIKAFEKNQIDEFTDGNGCVMCEDGDFLMVWDGSRSGYVGKAIKGAVGSTLMKLDFPAIEKNYAYYFLQSKFLELNTRAKGVGIPHVDPNILWNYNLPIPPKPVQRAIVCKIEELFSELNKGIENLRLAQQQLQVYRQSVLKRAFEGRLTNENVIQGQLPNGWRSMQIRNTCDNIKVGIVVKPANFYSADGKGTKAFRSANVREFHINDSAWVFFSEEANEENARTKLKEGDVLLVRSGYPGTSCVVSKKFEGSNAIDILIARPNQDIISSSYLCAFNNSPLGKGMFRVESRGMAQKHLNVGEYSKLKINLPSLKEQNNVVREIESRFSVADKLHENINQNLQQAEGVRQSILKKAFEGKLIQP